MLLITEGVRFIQLTGITKGLIKKVEWKAPRELLKVTGILPVTFAEHKADAGAPISYLTVNINNNKINLLQRFTVLGFESLNRWKPMKIDEEIESGSIVNVILEDIEDATNYPYNVTVYLFGKIQRNIP